MDGLDLEGGLSLEDVPLITPETKSTRFHPDVILIDGVTGETATLGLSQVDGPNSTVKLHMLQSKAMRNYQNSSTRSISLDDLDGLGDSGSSIASSLADIAEEPSAPKEGSFQSDTDGSQLDDSDPYPFNEPEPFGSYDPAALEEGRNKAFDNSTSSNDDSTSSNDELQAEDEEGNLNHDELLEIAQRNRAYQQDIQRARDAARELR